MFVDNFVEYRQLQDGRIVLLKDVSFDFGAKVVTAKAGFTCDGASIPKVFWNVIGHPFLHTYVRSAIIHDILYASKVYSKSDADSMFRTMLKADRVKRWKIPLMYYAVKFAGDKGWNSHNVGSTRRAKRFLLIKDK